MTDNDSARERAAAEAMAKFSETPLASILAGNYWLDAARVALRAADGVDVRNAADPWAPSPLGRLVSIDPVTGEQLNEAQIRAKLPRHG